MAMAGQIVQFKIGTKENLMKLNKIMRKVDIYVDGESGCLYIVPEEEEIDLKGSFSNFDFEIGSSGDNPFI